MLTPTPSADARLIPWLVHELSLTEKLKVTAGDAQLELINQRWDVAPDGSRTLCREIVMWAFDSPCWYARTLIPFATFHANEALFERLKTESLGDLIFHGTDIKRGSLTSYAITKQSPEFAWVQKWCQQDDVQLWVRLSELSVSGAISHPFVLKEILLPGLRRFLS